MNYSNLIKGKKVAIVGPASSLVGRELGDIIDNHDTIVRTNRGCELIDQHTRDLGSRTDILYSCLIEQKENAGYWDKEKIVDKFGVKYLCTTPNMSMKGIAPVTVLHHMVDKEKYREISQEIPCRIIDHTFFTKIALEIDCRPTTGYIAIHDILRYSPERLSIYGFDFYHSGWIDEYKGGMINQTVSEVLERTLNSKRHLHKNMWLHAKSTILNNPSVLIDDNMREVLEMDEWWYDKIKRKTV